MFFATTASPSSVARLCVCTWLVYAVGQASAGCDLRDHELRRRIDTDYSSHLTAIASPSAFVAPGRPDSCWPVDRPLAPDERTCLQTAESRHRSARGYDADKHVRRLIFQSAPAAIDTRRARNPPRGCPCRDADFAPYCAESTGPIGYEYNACMAAHYAYLLQYASWHEPRTAVRGSERAVADARAGRAFNVTFAVHEAAWTLGAIVSSSDTGDDATETLAPAEIVLGAKFGALLRLCLDAEALALLNRAARQRAPDVHVDSQQLMRANTNDVGGLLRLAAVYASDVVAARHEQRRRDRRWSLFMEALLGQLMEASGLPVQAAGAYTRALESRRTLVARVALAGLRRVQQAGSRENCRV